MHQMSPLRVGEKGCLVKRADSLLVPLIRELGVEEGVRLASLKKNWNQLFTEPLSSHMFPSVLSNGVLTLNVDSHVWLNELRFYKEEIIKKLSPFGIDAVRLRLGKVIPDTKLRGKRQRPVIKALTEDELDFMEKTVSRIEDQELKDIVRKAIVKSVATHKPKS